MKPPLFRLIQSSIVYESYQDRRIDRLLVQLTGTGELSHLYIKTHTHTHTHTHKHTHTYTHTHTHTYIHTYTHTRRHTDRQTHTHTHSHGHVKQSFPHYAIFSTTAESLIRLDQIKYSSTGTVLHIFAVLLWSSIYGRWTRKRISW